MHWHHLCQDYRVISHHKHSPKTHSHGCRSSGIKVKNKWTLHPETNYSPGGHRAMNVCPKALSTSQCSVGRLAGSETASPLGLVTYSFFLKKKSRHSDFSPFVRYQTRVSSTHTRVHCSKETSQTFASSEGSDQNHCDFIQRYVCLYPLCFQKAFPKVNGFKSHQLK